MKTIVYFVLLIAFFACSKYTTPKKVNKRLTFGMWAITEFIDNDQSLLEDYKNTTLIFVKSGTVKSISEPNVSGIWRVGDEKNPAVLYLSFPEIDGMDVLSDEWVVYKLSKGECVLKRKKTEEDFDYDSLKDRLILSRK